MSGRGFPLSSLSDEQRRAVRAQIADGAPVVSVGIRGHKASPHTGKGAKQGMSKLEQRFAAHLDSLKAQGAVSAWAYEPFSVALPAKRSRYRPDFALVAFGECGARGAGGEVGALGGGGLVLVEVKPLDKATGKPYWQTASRLRFLLAARALAGLARLVVAWPGPHGTWNYEEAST